MAKLFDQSKLNVSLHINNCFKEKELDRKSVVKEYLTTQLKSAPGLPKADDGSQQLEVKLEQIPYG